MPHSAPYILGFSDSVHDRAVCLFKGSQALFAIEEERLTRIKHGLDFKGHDTRDAAVFSTLELDAGHAEMHEARLDPLVDYCLGAAGIDRAHIGLWIGNSLHTAYPFAGQAVYVNHHRAHAASAWFASGFDDAAVLVLDGYGDALEGSSFETVSIYRAHGAHLTPMLRVAGQKQGLHLADSAGILYRTGSLLSGFGVMDDGKTMGLAAYGYPRHAPLIRRHFQFSGLPLRFNNHSIWQAFNERGIAGGSFEQRADIAASFQSALEDILLHYAATARELTGSRRLCLAGGVALNCVANQRIVNAGLFDDVFVFPAAGDSGIALGAAWLGAHSVLGLPPGEALTRLSLGRHYSHEEVEAAVEPYRAQLRITPLDPDAMAERAARTLSTGALLFWFQGGAEFGPRALGSRSLLGDPRRVEIRDFINSQVKNREAFRPLAPMVLEEDCARWFDARRSPFMLFSPAAHAATREAAPAIVHTDGSARLQTVARDNPAYAVLERFRDLTGVPILLNTSFNTHGEPIVETPSEAMKSFMGSPVRTLCIEQLYIEKCSGEARS